MAKVRVPVTGSVGKSVAIETDSPSRAEVTAQIAAAVAAISTGSVTPAQTAYPTLWRLIREVPPNIKGLASFTDTGILVRTGPGAYVARAVAVADITRLTVTDGDGTAGNPTLDMADISARSVWVRSAATDGKPAALQASGDKAVLHQSGTTLDFSTVDHTYVSDFDEAAQDAVAGMFVDSGRIDFTYNDVANTFTADIVANSVGNSYLRQSGGLSVIGRSANTTGDVADIVAGADDTLLRRSGTTLDFGQLTVGMFPNAVVTYAKIQNVSATSRILGRISAGAGSMEELTGTQTTTLLDVFTSSLKGLAPASGGGTANYLRADGTWATPPGTGGSGTVTSVAAGTGITASPSPITATGTLSVDQAFSPTWTGTHLFRGGLSRGGTTSQISLGLISGIPLFSLTNGAADTNKKTVEFLMNSSGQFTFQYLNEAASVAANIMQTTQGTTGPALADITFGNTTDNPTYTFAGSGLMTVSGGLLTRGALARGGTTAQVSLGVVGSTTPVLGMTNSAAGTNKKTVELVVGSSGDFVIQTLDEAVTDSHEILRAFRGTGIAISSITFGNGTDNPTYTFSGTGLTTFGGSVQVPNDQQYNFGGSDTCISGSTTTDTITIYTANAARLTIGASGQLTGANIHNGSGGNIRSGTYTPTLTNVANTSSLSASLSQWMRVGDVITVSGLATFTPSGSGVAIEFGISLPVASNFTAAGNCAGAAYDVTASGVNQCRGGVQADATNDRATLRGLSGGTGAQTIAFTFTYTVL